MGEVGGERKEKVKNGKMENEEEETEVELKEGD